MGMTGGRVVKAMTIHYKVESHKPGTSRSAVQHFNHFFSPRSLLSSIPKHGSGPNGNRNFFLRGTLSKIERRVTFVSFRGDIKLSVPGYLV